MGLIGGDDMKNSFVLYTDYIEHIELLSMEQRGILLTAIMMYSTGQAMPDMDGMTKMAFSFIKAQIDRDNEKYERTVAARVEAGKKGGRPQKQEEAKKANAFSDKQKKQGKAKKPDTVTDNDTDTVNDTDIKNIYTCAFETLWSAYPRKKEKARAFKCYKARLSDGFSEDALLTAVKRYAKECDIKSTEDTFIKHGATFFSSDKPFADYLAEDYKPPEKPKQKTVSKNLNNFERREYDMDALEEQILKIDTGGM